MKKTLLAAMAATLLFGNPAMATKVTYEDAVASSAGFYAANNAINTPPSARGLDAEELQEKGTYETLTYIGSGGTTYRLSTPGYYVVETSYGTSTVHVSSLKGTYHGSSMTSSNSAIGVRVDDGVLKGTGVYGTPTLKAIYRQN
ncbi:hypothetical protein WM008_20640 [Vibrio vulnificus]|uniref:hypothetical protein n=1 Tax=Vibrio vulnificus TaxID=672 RepID=UPI0030EE9DC3